jgi:hypothetical protein
LLIVKLKFAKFGARIIAAISGVSKSFTSALMSAPNATPMTIPTAISTTLPRSRKFLNPESIGPPFREPWRGGPRQVARADSELVVSAASIFPAVSVGLLKVVRMNCGAGARTSRQVAGL